MKVKCRLGNIERNHKISPRKLREDSTSILAEPVEVCVQSRETLGHVLGECCALKRASTTAKCTIQTAFDIVVNKHGVKYAFDSLVSKQAWGKRIELIRQPDWIFLLIKLKSTISDAAWQHLTNLTKLGRTVVSIYCVS